MKESYNEGLANYIDPESCLDDPRGRGKALTGGSTGGLLSSEITLFREPIAWTGREGNMNLCAMSQVGVCLGGVRELGMCGHSLRGNRDTSGRSLNGF